MAKRPGNRRDSKHRILCRGESIRVAGKYQFKYHINGKPHFVYSWRLESTDKLPAGKKPCLSLRELKKQIGYDFDSQMDPVGKNITVVELVERYLRTKTGVRDSTRAGYRTVQKPRFEKMVDGHTGFLFTDKDGMPLVAIHWEHRFNNMVKRYNDIFRVQMPNVTPHVCPYLL